MKVQFNEAQLSRPQQQSLIKFLDVLQAQNENELVVTPVEFPNKLLVMLDDNIGMLIVWDTERQTYAALVKPEPKPEPDGQFTPAQEPELDLSPIVERVEALARAFVKLAKPCDIDRRLELWIKFCIVVFKELME